jgi:hypothetical protein
MSSPSVVLIKTKRVGACFELSFLLLQGRSLKHCLKHHENQAGWEEISPAWPEAAASGDSSALMQCIKLSRSKWCVPAIRNLSQSKLKGADLSDATLASLIKSTRFKSC